METVNQLQQQYVDFLSSMYNEGLLDKQFLEIQELQNENDSQFVNKVVTIYLEESEILLQDLATALDQHDVDYEKVYYSANGLYESSLSFGSQRVKNACGAFRSCCNAKNVEGCLRCLQHMKDEFYLVKSKLQTLLTLEKQIVAAGGSMPIVE